MKKIVWIVALVWAFCGHAQAQNNLWHDANSSNPDVQAIHQMWESLYASLNAADIKKANSYYSENSSIVTTDGNVEFNISKAVDNLASTLQSLEPKPKFSYTNLKIRLLSDNMAMVLNESSMEFNGQKVTARAFDLLSKKSGGWRIEFEQMTPILSNTEGK